MNIGVVGLGLIGGSLARAIKKYTTHSVCGVDRDASVLRAAYEAGAIDSDTDVSGCELVFVCLYPRDCVSYMLGTQFMDNAVVADISGVKRYIADEVAQPLREKGLRYVGTHPMAGKENSGFASSDADLFQNASFIITIDRHTDAQAQTLLANLAEQIGFSRITTCSAQKHDEVIGYTSQLAHVVSNSYVKSEAAQNFEGFSAGSFMDLTRVAKLNPQMWAELFIENGDILTAEIDELIQNMLEIKHAVNTQDEPLLRSLLKKGSDIKEKLS